MCNDDDDIDEEDDDDNDNDIHQTNSKNKAVIVEDANKEVEENDEFDSLKYCKYCFFGTSINYIYTSHQTSKNNDDSDNNAYCNTNNTHGIEITNDVLTRKTNKASANAKDD